MFLYFINNKHSLNNKLISKDEQKKFILLLFDFYFLFCKKIMFEWV